MCVCVFQKDGDLFAFEQSGRRSTTSSVGGHGQIQDDLRYTTEPDEAGMESPAAMRDLQYTTLTAPATQDQQQPPQQQHPRQQQYGDVMVKDTRLQQPDSVEIEQQQLIERTEYEPRDKPLQLDINKSTVPPVVHLVHCC